MSGRRPGAHVRSGRPWTRLVTSRWGKRVAGMAAAALVIGLGPVGLSATAAATAQSGALAAAAAATLACTPGTIYSVAANGSLYQVDVATGAATQTGSFGTTNANGLAITPGGTAAYVIRQTGTGSTQVWAFDPASGTGTQVGTAAVSISTSSLVGGGINPLNGYYYFGGYNSSGDFVLFAFDTVAKTAIGEVGVVDLPATASTGGNGDLAFDRQGNMYLVRSSTGGSSNILVRVDAANVGTTASTATVPSTTLSSPPDGGGLAYNGMTFDSTGEIYLQNASSSTKVVGADPNTGTVDVSTSHTLSGLSVGVDLSSCLYPGTLQIKKDIAGRYAAGDQFTLNIARADTGTTSYASNTTKGSTTGLQNDAVAGPVIGVAGVRYVVSEAAAGTTNLSNYTTTYRCVRQDDGSTFASGTGTSATLPSFPSPAGPDGPNITCTFTNTPRPTTATLTLRKTVDNTAGGSLAPGDWTLTARHGTDAPAIGEAPAQAPGTSGATSTASTTAHTVAPNTYTLSEASTSTGQAYYVPGSWTCATAGGSPVPATNDQVTLNAGDDVTCAITNAYEPHAWSVAKSVDPPSGTQVGPGDTLTYTVTATSHSTQDIPGVVLTDDLSGVLDHATFGSATLTVNGTVLTPAPTPAGTTLATQAFTLPAGGTATLTYTVVVEADAWDTTLKNAATGTSPSFPPTTCPTGQTPGDGCTTGNDTTGLFTVVKQGPDGAALDGAAFRLLADDGGRPGAALSSPTVTAVSGAPGTFRIAGLARGSYWLEETGAPQGYGLLAAPVSFTVTTAADGVSTIALAASPTHPQVTVSSDGKTVTVTDTPANAGHALPLTGGTGNGPYVLGGLAIVAIAGLLRFVLHRRRRGAGAGTPHDEGGTATH